MLFYVRDRRNIVPRKMPADVAQKENFKATANGNKISSTFNQGLKETVKNGPVENPLSGATSATALTRKDASNVGPSMTPLMKEASVKKNNSLIMTESLVVKKDSESEPFSKVPLSSNPLEGLPVTNTKSIEGMSPSAPSGNGDAPNIENTTEAKVSDNIENRSSKKDLRVSVATSPNSDASQSSSTSKLAIDETSQKVSRCSFRHALWFLSSPSWIGFSPCFMVICKYFHLPD